MKKYKKITKLCLLAIFLFLFKIENVSAEAQCQVTAKKGATVDLERMAECMEDRYGFDEDIMRRGTKKEMAPTVELSFNKTDPEEGEKITALSSSKGFKNDTSNLYFTWYLIHTDEDGNATNTIEEGKREAMGIVARGDFDSNLFNVTYGPGQDDHDGYDAAFGGADGVGAKEGKKVGYYDDKDTATKEIMFDEKKQTIKTDSITRCYRHNFGIQVGHDNIGDSGSDGDSGRDQIISCRDNIYDNDRNDELYEFANCGAHRTGDGDFDWDEEECWGTDPENPDTDGDGVRDEADLVGLNQTQFTWIYKPGDRVGVTVEGTSLIPIVEGGTFSVFSLNGYSATNPETGEVSNFSSMAAASTFCSTFLPDSIDMGGTSTNTVTGVVTTTDADVADYNAGVALYDACDDSIEENYSVIDGPGNGSINAYYKIMWATTGICSNHNDSSKWGLENGCEEDEDLGFNYLATTAVNESGGAILDPELAVIPEEPQFDAVEPILENKRSDLITVNASLSNESVNEDFLYYKWTVDRCEGNDFTDCNHPVTGLDYETFTEGMGIRELRFSPTEDIFGALAGSPAMAFDDNKAWLRVSVVVSEHEFLAGGANADIDGRVVGSLERIYFPVTKNIVDMNLYKAVRDDATGTWKKGPQICDTGLYKDICPVYPFEVLVAESVVADGSPAFDRYAWQMNEQKIDSVVNCRIFGGVGCTTVSDEVFFSVNGTEDSIASIEVANKRDDANFVTQRILSVSSPQAVIETVGGATATIRTDGTISDTIFEADNMTVVTFKAIPVPRYLTINADAIQDDNEVNLVWYINDTEITSDFLAQSPQPMGLNVTIPAFDEISFTIPVDMTMGTGIDLKARLVKKFSSGGDNEYVEMLKDTWGIIDSHTVAKDSSVSVRTSFNMALAQGTTLKQYLASSINNAPHYLIFVIRLAIAMVLIWSVLFGFSYAVNLNKEL